MKDSIRDKIEEFWEWFVNNERLIIEIINDDFHEGRESLGRNMDNFILQFGMFTWEMGPIDGYYYLTISPNGSEELLEVSKEIVAYAPNLSPWKFYAAKPKKEWDLKFKVFDDFMTAHEVDASVWEYFLNHDSLKKTEITILASNISHLDGETKLTAADLVVTSLLGEAFKIQNVGSIKVIDDFDSIQSEKSSAIHKLSSEFS